MIRFLNLREDHGNYPGYIFVVRGIGASRIRRKSGIGSVLIYLVEHKGEQVSLDMIAKIGKWKHTKKGIRDLVGIVNGRAGYEIIKRIEEEDRIYYKLRE
jgi:hypothetical protein